MKRLFWVVFGITVGVLAMRKLSRAAEKLTPHGMASSIGSGLTELADAVREFATDVREAMTERESQLREATGLDGRIGRADANGSAPRPDPA